MLTDLINNMRVPGLVCTVGIIALIVYSIMKGGKGNGGSNGSSSSGGFTPPPSTGA